jgi:hypothetical protein
MCGIVGIVGKGAVAPLLYDALIVLQHRGQDAGGIATLKGHQIRLHKGNGLVRDVFEPHHMAGLEGNVGIGHVRYPTAGMDDSSEAQPFYVNSPYGIALGHNGNLINTEELTQELFDSDRRHLNTKSDSEVLLNVLAHELQRQNPAQVLSPAHIFEAVDGVYRRCRGAFSTIALICGHGVLGFRDPHGIRPMVLGSRETDQGTEYALASESVALDVLGFRLMRDVGPGESIFITLDGQLHTHTSALAGELTPCIFEFVIRPPGLMPRHLRLQGAPAHGAGPGAQDPARAARSRHRRGDTGAGHQPHGGAAAGLRPEREVPRGFHQEPLYRAHLHHARPQGAQEIRAAETQRYRSRIPQEERFDRRRLDRAWHDVQADHPDGPRGGRPQGLFRLRGSAGALPEHLRYRHAGAG